MMVLPPNSKKVEGFPGELLLVTVLLASGRN